jgi:hypothetical protein
MVLDSNIYLIYNIGSILNQHIPRYIFDLININFNLKIIFINSMFLNILNPASQSSAVGLHVG